VVRQNNESKSNAEGVEFVYKIREARARWDVKWASPLFLQLVSHSSGLVRTAAAAHLVGGPPASVTMHTMPVGDSREQTHDARSTCVRRRFSVCVPRLG
jgi:hypothetical protein